MPPLTLTPADSNQPTPDELRRRQLMQMLGGGTAPAQAPSNQQLPAPTATPPSQDSSPQNTSSPPAAKPLSQSPQEQYAAQRSQFETAHPEAAGKPPTGPFINTDTSGEPSFQQPSLRNRLLHGLFYGMEEFGRPGQGIKSEQEWEGEQAREREAVRNWPMQRQQNVETAFGKELGGQEQLAKTAEQQLKAEPTIDEQIAQLAQQPSTPENQALIRDKMDIKFGTMGGNFTPKEIIDQNAPQGHRTANFSGRTGRFYDQTTHTEIPGAQEWKTQAKWDLEKDPTGAVIGARDPMGNILPLTDPNVPQGLLQVAQGTQGKAPETKTILQNGKSMVMAWNPKTQAFDVPVGEAPGAPGETTREQEPVFAFDPKTKQRILTTRAEAASGGLTHPIKAEEGSVQKEEALTRQFNDVQMNVSHYKTAINSLKVDIPADHVERMTQIIATLPQMERAGGEGIIGQLTMGMFPTVANQLQQGEMAKAWNSLTPQEQDLMTGYFRARGSLLAYQRALTGSGRSSQMGLALEMPNLPEPYVGATVANKRLQAFQENIDKASQGIVRVPWLDTPEDIRKGIEPQQSQAAPQNTQAAQPERPQGVPPEAVWNPEVRRWQLPRK